MHNKIKNIIEGYRLTKTGKEYLHLKSRVQMIREHQKLYDTIQAITPEKRLSWIMDNDLAAELEGAQVCLNDFSEWVNDVMLIYCDLGFFEHKSDSN